MQDITVTWVKGLTMFMDDKTPETLSDLLELFFCDHLLNLAMVEAVVSLFDFLTIFLAWAQELFSETHFAAG
jgi:hypothetical protein